jgi:hypothetical protein
MNYHTISTVELEDGVDLFTVEIEKNGKNY